MALDNKYATEVARKMAEPPPKPIRFHIIEEIECLNGGQWYIWKVTAEMSDGSEVEGSVQGGCENSDSFAAETWEVDPE